MVFYLIYFLKEVISVEMMTNVWLISTYITISIMILVIIEGKIFNRRMSVYQTEKTKENMKDRLLRVFHLLVPFHNVIYISQLYIFGRRLSKLTDEQVLRIKELSRERKKY